MYRPPRDGKPEIRIPVRHDSVNGGFWIDYIPRKHKNRLKRDHYTLLAQVKRNHACPAELVVPEYDDAQVKSMMKSMWDDKNRVVDEVIVGQHKDDRTIRAVKEGLRNGRSMMTATEFHELVGHLGSCLLYTSPSPRDQRGSRMPSSA